MVAFVSWFPDWYIATCLIAGMVIVPLFSLLLIRPLLRGFSHGLYEVVLFWKAGVSAFGMFKRCVKLLFIDIWFWHLLNSTTTSTSCGPASWSGIFSWSFRKGFTRANSKREAKANKETEHESA